MPTKSALTNDNAGNPGQFQLSFRGSNFVPAALDALTATAAQVQAARQHSTDWSGECDGCGRPHHRGNPPVTTLTPYTITFQGALAATDVDPIVVSNIGEAEFNITESVRGTPNAPGVLVNEIQRLTIGSQTATFGLEFGGAVTPITLTETATALQVQQALQGLATIAANGGGVIVTGNQGPWDVEFTGLNNGNRDINLITEGLLAAGSSGTVTFTAQRWIAISLPSSRLPTADQLRQHAFDPGAQSADRSGQRSDHAQ
jgi:hypothetical protein